MPLDFPLTRADALRRWQDFLPQASRYAGSRNFVQPSHEHVSRLSPAIRLGLMHPEEIVRDTLAQHAWPKVEKWLQEICWRTYWKGWLEMRPQVWRSWRRQLHGLKQQLPAKTLARAQAVSEGRSGVAVMDAFARELRETGYLHNHARMWWASFWIHEERLPWELGAEFFFQHLLDADPASNTLSWRWVAGLQTAGKTYLVRRSNLEKYASPSLLTDRTGLERLEDGLIKPCPPGQSVDLTPQSLPDLSCQPPALPQKVGLWLHPDDLHAENSPLHSIQPVSTAAFFVEPAYVRYGLSRLRMQSLQTALQDGLHRAGKHFSCPAHLIATEDIARSFREWVQRDQLEAVVALAPAVGPVSDTLAAIRDALGPVPLILVRRPWDSQLFRHARSGFFPFWEKTSRWLSSEFSSLSPA